jgi:hypothetical protein
VDRLTSTPVRPSQQVASSPNDLSDIDKKKKLPRELCVRETVCLYVNSWCMCAPFSNSPRFAPPTTP